MPRYSLSHLSDGTLLHDLAALVARDRATTAELLAHIAEVDARQLYRAQAYPSMCTYCVGELGLSEDAAAKRIQVARVAREFPGLFEAIADGRLHLSAVVLLAPHLRRENIEELMAAASHKTKAEVDQLLVARFPKQDVPARLEPIGSVIPGQGASGALALSSVAASDASAPGVAGLGSAEHAPGHVGMTIPEPFSAPTTHARVAPLSPGRFALQATISQRAHDALRHAQALLSHREAAGGIPELLEMAFEALVERLEKRKFAATARPRPGSGQAVRRNRANPRVIPAHVKRAVWERDGGRCTFESDAGRRCEARSGLEFDHVVAVARGGEATVAGIRLRCRAHNQLEAERVFGSGFMREKRDASRRRAEAARAPKAALRAPDPERDVTPWLRSLGLRAGEARSAADLCEATIPDAPIEAKVRFALQRVGERLGRKVVPAGLSTA